MAVAIIIISATNHKHRHTAGLPKHTQLTITHRYYSPITQTKCSSHHPSFAPPHTILAPGLTPEDRQRLIDTVDVIFHCAASVRFDDPLRDAVLLNTRSAREVCDLALRMSRLAVLVHVSTTYCNTNRKVIDEKLYPAHADWKTAIRMAEELDPRVLEVMTAKYLGDMPNTYTFTKQLAEHVVNDMCGGKVPVVVFRPSIGK